MANLEKVRVLLLDQGMQPIDVINGRKAIEKLYEGKADVLEEYADIPIRSQRLTLNLPCVMMLNGAGHYKRRFVKFSRPNVFWRDGYICQYCCKKFPAAKLTLDHVIPKSNRTPDSYKSWTNIVTACKPCNQKKRNRTPQEAKMKLLREPFKPSWEPAMTIQYLPNDPAVWESYLKDFL
jgi:5-methylcytosine-specific restriction endonuclease McrA